MVLYLSNMSFVQQNSVFFLLNFSGHVFLAGLDFDVIECAVDVVCPISVTLFFLVLLLLLTQSLDMIDDEVSYLWVVCDASSDLNLLFAPYMT